MSPPRSPRPLRRLLVANRGEIARRIVRSARALGMETVAVVTDADAAGGGPAPHARDADRTVHLGPAAAHLDAERLVDAARRAGADAVHPGYGFLSENADFARACRDAGLVWVGPDPETIRAMGDKAAAKRMMAEAGVPVLGGGELPEDPDEALGVARGLVDEIGLPVLVKAVAGGGGRGLRRVDDAGDLAAALEAARSEAEASFGDGRLLLERLVPRARHVEVQILADAHGRTIHLGERDCTAQRRHQKIVEESPCPVLGEEARERLCAVAVRAAEAVGYVGAGTVEMLLDLDAPQGDGEEDHAFFFLEMNTRLQVEHPVTEMLYGLDLVAWQLRVAAGQALPEELATLTPRGHAMEARLYAEDPARGFAPSPGPVVRWRPPEEVPGVLRVDHAVGAEVPPDFDPMVAKIVARGADRDDARRRLVRALEETVLLGPQTNRAFLLDLLEHEDFAASQIDVGWVERELCPWEPPDATPSVVALAAIRLSEHRGPRTDLWGWRSQAGTGGWPVELLSDAGADDGERHELRLVPLRPPGRDPRRVYRVEPDGGEPFEIDVVERAEDGDGAWRVASDGVEASYEVVMDGDVVRVDDGRVARGFRRAPVGPIEAVAVGDPTRLTAPMAGGVKEVRVAEGDAVEAGQCLVVIEAMKLETRLDAAMDGTVADVRIAAGDQVARGEVVIRLLTAG